MDSLQNPMIPMIDFWMSNVEHPKIVALQFKGDIYALVNSDR